MFKFILTSLIICLFTIDFLPAQPQGAPGNETVYPVSINPFSVPQETQHNILSQAPERGPVPDPELLEKIKHTQLPYDPDDKSVIRVSTEGSDAVPVYIWNSWNGPSQNGWVPADPDIAEGSGTYDGWTVIVTNEQIHIYSNSTHSVLITNTFQNWFSPVGAVTNIFDPKVIYDIFSSRWVFMALGRNASQTESYYYVSVSQTFDPTGNWWTYRLNAHVDGSVTTNNWADYPGLGFSYPTGGSGNVGCVAITSNQYQNGGGPFQYAKVRLLKTSQLYAGAGLTWYDFWNYTDANSEKAFTPKPARQLFSTPSGGQLYMFNTKWYGSNVVTLWRIDNPTAATPTLTRQATISTTAYTIPPAAPSLGGGTVDAFDCRTQNVWFMNGYIYTAWVSAVNWGSGNNAIVHYVRISTATNSVVNESRFGNVDIWFMHPSACPEYKSPYSNGDAGIQFAISGSALYPSHCVIGYEPVTGLSPYYTVSGTGSLGAGFQRYGDYGGITPNAVESGVFWSAGMIANSGSWGTGAFRFSFSPPPIGIQNNYGQVPSEYSLMQNYPNPFNPLTIITFGIPHSGMVNITVYDMLGREISVPVNEFKEAGMYDVTFDASSIPSGLYFYKITAGSFSETRKMVLVK